VERTLFYKSDVKIFIEIITESLQIGENYEPRDARCKYQAKKLTKKDTGKTKDRQRNNIHKQFIGK
jgi:hypothetical protein